MHLLVATDGSAESDLAVRLAAVTKEVTGALLTFLTVVKDETEIDQTAEIFAQARSLLASGTAAQEKIRHGHPAEEIVQEAAEGNYDLIILGDKTRHGIISRLLTPTVLRVIEHMPCPVFIARGAIRPLRRGLICHGRRDPSLLDRLVAQLAPLLSKLEELTTLHVMSQIAAGPGVPGWELQAEAEELIEKHTIEGTMLEEDLATLAVLNVTVEAKVRHGLVVRQILAEMADGDYDMVVIGSHQSEGWARYLLNDVAQELINRADRPLLVV